MEFKAFISPSAIFLGTGSDCHLGPERKVEYCEPFKPECLLCHTKLYVLAEMSMVVQ